MSLSPLQLAMKVLHDMPAASLAELEAAVQHQSAGLKPAYAAEAKAALFQLKLEYDRMALAQPVDPTRESVAIAPEQFVDNKHRYLLKARIGRGGMGDVWWAEDTLRDRKRVAVKWVRFDKSDQQASDRFFREAYLLSSLTSNFIVRYMDWVTDTVIGSPCLIMEYLDATPITAWVKTHRSVRHTVDAVRMVCLGLEEALCRGIIHRDLKPTNILVTTQNIPKVIDLGLAGTIHEAFTELPSLTSVGILGGTLPYVSPEQLRGLHQAGPGSDVFALGMILFELLSEHVLFPGGTPTWPQMLAMADAGIPLQSLSGPLIDGKPPSPLLVSIVRGALEWDVEKRFGSVSDLAEELRIWLNKDAGGGKVAIPPRRPSPGREFERRRLLRQRAWAVATASVLLALLVLLALSERSLRSEKRRSDATLAVVAGLIAQADPYAPGKAMPPAAARKLLTLAAPLLAERRGELGRSALPLELAVADSTYSLGDTEAAEVQYASLAERCADGGAETRHTRIEALRGWGVSLGDLGRRDDAQRQLRMAIDLAMTAADPEVVGSCFEALAVVLLDGKDFAAADEAIRQAEPYYQGQTERAQLGRATLLILRAAVQAQGLDDSGSLVSDKELEAAVSAIEHTLGADNLDALRVRQAVLSLRLEAAIRAAAPLQDRIQLLAPMRDCFRRYEQAFGLESDTACEQVTLLCRALNFALQFDEAEALVQSAMAARHVHAKPPTLVYAHLLQAIASTYTLKNSSEAVDKFKEAQVIIGTQLGKHSPEYAVNSNNIAVAMYRCGKYCDAIAALREVLKQLSVIYESASSKVRGARLYLALALWHCDASFAREGVDILEELAAPMDGSLDTTARMAVQELPAACDAAGMSERAEHWRRQRSDGP